MRTKALILIFLSACLLAQVGDIKRKSSENAGRRSEGGRSGSSSTGTAYFIIDLFRLVGVAQSAKLQKADSVNRIISLETYFQGAVQPSNYYIGLPRIR